MNTKDLIDQLTSTYLYRRKNQQALKVEDIGQLIGIFIEQHRNSIELYDKFMSGFESGIDSSQQQSVEELTTRHRQESKTS